MNRIRIIIRNTAATDAWMIMEVKIIILLVLINIWGLSIRTEMLPLSVRPTKVRPIEPLMWIISTERCVYPDSLSKLIMPDAPANSICSRFRFISSVNFTLPKDKLF